MLGRQNQNFLQHVDVRGNEQMPMRDDDRGVRQPRFAQPLVFGRSFLFHDRAGVLQFDRGHGLFFVDDFPDIETGDLRVPDLRVVERAMASARASALVVSAAKSLRVLVGVIGRL